MGGDCSQKLCPGGECYSSPGRSRSSDQYEINNSIAKIGCPRTRLSGEFFFPCQRQRDAEHFLIEE
jgi:hypothetical protein